MNNGCVTMKRTRRSYQVYPGVSITERSLTYEIKKKFICLVL